MKKINNYHDLFNALFDILDNMKDAELKGKWNKDATKSIIEYYLREAFKVSYEAINKEDNK